MPGGGFGGGGKPPEKQCPRCARKSLDEIVNWIGGMIVGSALPACALWLFAFSRLLPELPGDAQGIVFTLPMVGAVVGSVFGARYVARRLGWHHECPHCRFSWPLETGERLVAALRDRVLGALLERGFRALAPETGSGEAYRIEGDVGGRHVILVQRRGAESVQLSLAVAHGSELTAEEQEGVRVASARFERAVADLPQPSLLRSVSLGDGELRVTLAKLPASVDDLDAIIELGGELAPSFERVPIEVHGIARRAFARAGVPRCAYCHADITGQEADLVACEQCSTVLHEGCRRELGRCPTLGCREGPRDRLASS